MIAGIAALVCCAGCATQSPKPAWTAPPEPEAARPDRDDSAALSMLDGPLSVTDVMRLAILASPEVAAAKAELTVSERLVTTVKRRRRDPELRVSYGEGDVETTRNTVGSESEFYTLSTRPSSWSATNSAASLDREEREGYEIALRLFPRNPWEQSARVSRARAAFHAAEAARVAAEVTAAVDACRAFAVLQFAQQDAMLAEAMVEARKLGADHARELADGGQITLLDKATALSRYLRALSDLNEAIETRDVAEAGLCGLLHTGSKRLEIAWEGLPLTYDTMEQLPFEQLQKIALSARADIAGLGWNRAAARAAVRGFKSAYLPWLDHIQASYGERSADGSRRTVSSETDLIDSIVRTASDTTTIDGDREEWEVSAAISLPVFSWWAQEHRVAQAELQQAGVLEEQAIEQMRDDIRAACRRLGSLKEQMESFSAAATPVVTELEEVISTGGDAMSLPPAEFARLREQVIETRRLTLQVELARVMARLDLCAALGGANLRPGVLSPEPAQ